MKLRNLPPDPPRPARVPGFPAVLDESRNAAGGSAPPLFRPSARRGGVTVSRRNRPRSPVLSGRPLPAGARTASPTGAPGKHSLENAERRPSGQTRRCALTSRASQAPPDQRPPLAAAPASPQLRDHQRRSGSRAVCGTQASGMKNPHVVMDQRRPADGNKKFKRKVRGAFSRGSAERDGRDSEQLADAMGLLVGEVYGNICETRLQRFAPAAAGALNTALDMTVYGFPVIAGNMTDAPPAPLPEAAAQRGSDKASPPDTELDTQQAFPKDCAAQSRVALCKRSERSLSAAPRGSYTTSGATAEPLDSPRKRLAEPPGVVTEIKAIQQTRRLLANARERTRVHTISAAFEALRKQVPCYSYGQKLSKLAILRIACNYILSLAQLADLDYTPDHSNMSFRECVEQCTRTLQAEGRSKKRKE
ncbi:hypothetical protein AOLI_G00066760 [Acnodon oligacanthus]